jgi:hypothetical protein
MAGNPAFAQKGYGATLQEPAVDGDVRVVGMKGDGDGHGGF